MAVLDAFPANSEDPNIKFSRGSMPPDSSQRFDQDIAFAPLSWLLPCVGATDFPVSALCTAFFSNFAS